MSRGHNKKRNTGLMYEFLVRSISRCLVEGDQRHSSAALKIIRKHFKPGTELYREFRLINSLMKTTVTSDGVANSIIQEAKLAARQYDVAKLDREKSLLIRAVNHGIKDPHFYDQQIDEYRMYATLQQLINDWRDPDRDLERQARFEDQLVKWLTTEKPKAIDQVVSGESAGTSRLLMKVMMQKLNEKYSTVLNDRQKDLVRAYAWASTNDDKGIVRAKLQEVKDSLLASISSYVDDSPDDEYTVEQLTAARDQLVTETLDEVDDDTLTRFMLYLKLNDELLNEDNNG